MRAGGGTDAALGESPAILGKKRWFKILIMTVPPLASTILCLGLASVSRKITGSTMYNFLAWDLFLAWVPFFLAVLLGMTTTFPNRAARNTAGFLAAAVWLFFYPNSLYLVTELLHAFRHFTIVPGARFWYEINFWYILLTVFLAAFTGLLLSSISLYLVHNCIQKYRGIWSSWLLVLLIGVLSSLGVYIGRFIRWNSWDIVSSPHRIIADVASIFSDSQEQSLFLPFTAMIFLIHMISYSSVYSLISAGSSRIP